MATVAALVAYFFYGFAQMQAGTGRSPLIPALLAYQLCVFVSVLPQRRNRDFFVEPPGLLLPYACWHLMVYWYWRTTGPLTLGLAVAYLATAAGLPGLGFAAGAAALAADVATLTACALGFGALRWHFRTYAPVWLRLVLAAGSTGLARPLLIAGLTVCLILTLQIAFTGILVTSGTTEFLREFFATLRGTPNQGLRLTESLDLGFDLQLLVLSRLVVEGREQVQLAGIWARALTPLLVLPLLVLPAYRREEPWDATTVGRRFADRCADGLAVCLPRTWRVAGRLILPFCNDVLFFVFSTVAIAFATGVALATAGDPPADLPATRARLSYLGYILAAFNAASITPLVRRLAVATDAFSTFCVLPVSPAGLLIRMYVLGASLLVALQVVVVGTWGRLMLPSDGVALMFCSGMAALVTAGAAGSVWMQTIVWYRSHFVRRLVTGVWLLGTVGGMMAHYSVTSTSVEILPWALACEALLALSLAAAMIAGLQAMEAQREAA